VQSGLRVPIKLTRQQLHDLYYYLRLNRRVDEQLVSLYRQGKVVGGVYSGLGQEAISVGSAYALEAAAQLEKEGLSLEVVDLRTLLPYDEDAILASVRKCNKVILLHEDTRTGGMAGELAALIAEKAFEDLEGPIVRVTAPDTPVPFSPPLEEFFLPNAQRLIEAARRLAAY
jgi:pyruvate/2-oxoglutarate/acetoin dehydrogenase E1 component